MSSNLPRFLGGTPFRVFIYLLALFFTVGLVLATLGIQPSEIFSWLEWVAARIWEMGYEARDIIETFLDFISIPPELFVPI